MSYAYLDNSSNLGPYFREKLRKRARKNDVSKR